MTIATPSVSELADEIQAHSKWLAANFTPDQLIGPGDEIPGGDIRIQCDESGWQFHSGDPQYDTDHRGAWGYGFCPLNISRKEAVSIAHDMIDEAQSDEYESDDESDED